MLIFKEVKKLIKNLDFFGESIHLRIKDQTTSKTFIGGIISIITSFCLFIMFILMSLDMFFKQNPFVSLENRILPSNPNITLDKNSLPISFVLQDSSFNAFYNPKIIKIEAYLMNSNGTYNLLDLESCGLKNFPLLSNQTFYNSMLQNNLCIKNQNVSIGGYMQDTYWQYLSIGVRICKNSTESSVICESEEEIRKMFEGNLFYFNLYFQNNLFNIQNYLNPAIPHIKNLYKIIKYGTYKEGGLFLKNQILNSDNGFFIESMEQSNILSFDREYYEFSDMQSDGYLCIFFINSSNLLEIYRRNYLKVQDVLANVGALSNVFIEALRIFLSIFSSMAINEYILNKIFDFHFEKGQIPKNDKINLTKQIYVHKSNFQKSIQEENKCDNNIGTNKNDNIQNENNVPLNCLFPTNREKGNEEVNHESDVLKYVKNKNKKNRLKFTYYDMLKMYFLPCFNNIELKVKISLLNKSLDFLSEYLDISYIIMKLSELEKLKLILFNYEQIAVFNYISKDICTIDDLEMKEDKIAKFRFFQKDKIELAKSISKFKIKFHQDDNINEIDKKLYDLLRDDLKY